MAHAPQPHATGTGRILQKEISGVAASEMGLSTSGQNLVDPTEWPHALRRVTQARWVASARATSG